MTNQTAISDDTTKAIATLDELFKRDVELICSEPLHPSWTADRVAKLSADNAARKFLGYFFNEPEEAKAKAITAKWKEIKLRGVA